MRNFFVPFRSERTWNAELSKVVKICHNVFIVLVRRRLIRCQIDSTYRKKIVAVHRLDNQAF